MAYPITQEFQRALKSPKQTIVNKVEMLDNLTLGRMETIYGIDDGVVSVTDNRATRRTAQLRLADTDGIFSILMTSSYFFVGNMFRIYTGLRYYSDTLGQDVDTYVPVGTFTVDRPEVFTERGMGVITVDASDLSKRIAMGGFQTTYSTSTRLHVNTIMQLIANDAGIPSSWLKLDPLLERTLEDRAVEAGYGWTIGEDRIRKIEELSKDFGIDIFFDPLGHLTTKPVERLMSSEPVWEYSASKDSTMFGVTKIQDDLSLFNHIVIYASNTITDKTEILFSLIDDDVNSPTYYGRIGKRTLAYTTPSIWTEAQARVSAFKLFIDNCYVNEQLKITSVRLPHLDVGDMIFIDEPQRARVFGKYRISSFDLSLRDGRMVIDAKQIRKIYGEE